MTGKDNDALFEEQYLARTGKSRARRLKWFKEARFGMFIHWGLYSQIGRDAWVMNLERIPVERYEKLAATWKPKPGCVRELLSNYGTIDILWYDVPWPLKTPQAWDSYRLNAMARHPNSADEDDAGSRTMLNAKKTRGVETDDSPTVQ